MDWFAIIVRIFHIGAGVFWVGAAWAFFLFFEPGTKVLEPATRQAFLGDVMIRRRFPVVMTWASVITVIAGLLLYWHVSGGLQWAWISSPSGIGFTIGALGGIIALAIGASIIGPNVGRLSALGGRIMAEGRPPTPEEGAMLHGFEERINAASRMDFYALLVAVFFMAISRYL